MDVQHSGGIVRLIPLERLTYVPVGRGGHLSQGLAGRILPGLGPAIEDMLQRLARIASAPDMRGEALRRQATAIALTSMRAGLPSLMRAAHHLADCACRHDETALAATRARLLRLAKQAASREWLIGNGSS